MKSHESAHQLLQQEDTPVVLFCRESYIYSAVTGIEEVFTRRLKVIQAHHILNV